MDDSGRNPKAVTLALNNYINELIILKKYSAFAFILPGIGNILVFYIPPLIVAAIIARFGNEVPTINTILPYLLLIGAVWMLGELLWRISVALLNITGVKAEKRLLVSALNELFKKDIGFFHDNFSGSLTKKTISYGKSFEQFQDTLAVSVFANVIPFIFTLFVLWFLSPWLVLVLIVSVALVGLLIIPLIKKRQKMVTAREAASNLMAGHVADVISNMDAVMAFAAEPYEAKQHLHYVTNFTTKLKRSWDYHNTNINLTISPLYVLINVVGLGVALLTGSSGKEISTIFITFSYFAFTTRVLWEFNSIYKNLETSITEAAQFTSLLLENPDTNTKSKNLNRLIVKSGAISFNNVCFSYDKSIDNLFNNLNFSIKSGEKIALVGHSGGGKTTITKLLLRFKEINSGSITIDGQNIANVSLSDLRKSIAYVPQEPAMFHRSIADNIKYGNLHATTEDIVLAAKQANAHDFITSLPDGYQTMVGERGVKLSGGQRQRIAIARAFIKNAPIVVLDEATSALDSQSELLIQEALWKLIKGRTTIIIAHRLSTIQKVDRIIVIDNGKITEQGNHKQLSKSDGIYSKLWNHQSGGFLD